MSYFGENEIIWIQQQVSNKKYIRYLKMDFQTLFKFQRNEELF